MTRERLAQKLLLLLLVFVLSFAGLLAAGGAGLYWQIIIAGVGFAGAVWVVQQIYQIYRSAEENRELLKEQNFEIIKKAINLSDNMRKFEDKTYELENSEKELNRTLKLIREKERDHSIIFNNSPIGIIRLEKDGRIAYCNDKFIQLVNGNCDTLIGYNTLTNAPKEVTGAIKKALNGEMSVYEGPLPGPDKEAPLYLRIIFNPVNPGTFPTEVIATFEDISKRILAEKHLRQANKLLEQQVQERTKELVEEIVERQNALEKLKKSEEKYRSIMESIEDAYLELDLDGNLIFFNNALPKLLEKEERDIDGVNCRSFIAAYDADRFFNSIRTVLNTGQTSPLEYFDFMSGRGAKREVGIIFSLIKDKFGNPSGIQGLARDVTRQRAMEAQLIHTQKMEAIGSLAGGVAHDFNNILGGIIGYAQLISKSIDASDRIYPYVDQIIKGSERATGIVKQILLFSRDTKSEKAVMDIGELATEALKLIRASIPSTINIQSDIQKNLNPILADQTQMHQVFMNLCSNAAAAMRERGGRLTVALSRHVQEREAHIGVEAFKPGGYLKIVIEDTGVGMDKKVLERIFDPYFTTKQAGEGTGLGLATVLGIVEDHDGLIKVDSKPGEGTVFTLFFPEVEPVKKEARKAVEVRRGAETILFVDDESYLADVGKEMLEDYGYKVHPFTNPMEALRMFEDNPEEIDLVITDYTMPEMTGRDLLKRIKSIRPDLPGIMCTGIVLDPERLEDVDVGLLLMKPLDMEKLLVSVRDILDKKTGRN